MSMVAAAGAAAAEAVPASPATSPKAGAVSSPEVFARDAIIAWFRGEFAAANAIIDALCNHLTQIDGADDYGALFAAIHRRRMNWIPVLHMQKYFSIADVARELRRAAGLRRAAAAAEVEQRLRERTEQLEAMGGKRDTGVILKEVEPEEVEEEKPTGEAVDKEWAGWQTGQGSDQVNEGLEVEAPEMGAEGREIKGEETEGSSGDSAVDSPDRSQAVSGDVGSTQGGLGPMESAGICSDHEDCAARPESIKVFKGFVAKEPVKGQMVNVVKGLKLYQDVFAGSELLRLTEFINELHLAGRRGELSGHTFIFFNQQLKGNKRETIQLGVPIFQPTKEDVANQIQPIPEVLQSVVDHLIQWRLIPDSRTPNSCIINFFDEGEYSQPYFKPPHLDNPVSTLLLANTTMTFGRFLASDHNGNYKGSLTLTLKEGSLLVMRGNSANVARHVVCPSSNTRISITFAKVRPSTKHVAASASPPLTEATTLWQPSSPPPQKLATGGGAVSCKVRDLVPRWGVALQAPVLVFSPPRPIVTSATRRFTRGGTGVFLPWTVGPKKYTKHLPPRILKRRLPSLTPPIEAQVKKQSPIACAV